MVGLTNGFFSCVQLVVLSWIFILYTWLGHVLIEVILTKLGILETGNTNLKSNMTFQGKFGVREYLLSPLVLLCPSVRPTGLDGTYRPQYVFVKIL